MAIVPLLLYNTLTRKKERFAPSQGNRVRLYSCGPTVYNYAHIGNLRTYIFNDTLKRALLWKGWKVNHIMNITDVGHLTSDADSGEDKMESGAQREGKTVWDIAAFYTQAFQQDIAEFNILPPTRWTKATEHIAEQIRLIRALERTGHTYETPEVVYFDTSTYKDYPRLARLSVEHQKEGVRVDVDPNRKHPSDFVLWFKRVGKYAHHVMHWPSPWQEGFPGWHIECSAMSIKYLKPLPIDIHTGGIDHIPVHHTNERAQSEAATGKPFVRFWVHGAFLTIHAGRMGKSEGNFLTLKTLTDRGYDPLSYRLFVLQSHYRAPLDFTWEALDAAQKGFTHLKNSIRDQGLQAAPNKKTRLANTATKLLERFDRALSNDLNTAKALTVVWDVVRSTHLNPKEKSVLLARFDTVLGLLLFRGPTEATALPPQVRDLIEERAKARANKDWNEADRLRKKIARLGFTLEDTPRGTRIVRPKTRS